MKRTPLKRKPKPAMTGKERQRAYDWRVAAVVNGCVMCAKFSTAEVHASRRPDLFSILAHHVLPKQALKQEHLHTFLWDDRNGLGVCEYHHTRHHNHIQRIPRSLLRDETHEFAYELELGWLLDMEYPA